MTLSFIYLSITDVFRLLISCEFRVSPKDSVFHALNNVIKVRHVLFKHSLCTHCVCEQLLNS